ncbi:MAG: SnoaL-like domain-containing protein [Halieaceae bacterium]|nr:SnoaL-like domain-containing protein [Halieaceae bacterium]
MTLEEKIVSSINTYLDSFEKKDLDAIIDLYADDCWIEDPVGTEKKVGKDALREFYQLGIDMGVKGSLESEVRVVGNEAAFAFKIDMESGEGTFSTRPIDSMTFNEDGKITTMRAFWGPRNQGMK